MSISSIKYVLKYVHKGCDQATFALRSDQVDEISEYQNARYVSSNKAAWSFLSTKGFQLFSNFQCTWKMASEFILLKTLQGIRLQVTLLRQPRLNFCSVSG